MNPLGIARRIPYFLMMACVLVAVADFVTTWLALARNPVAEEQGLLASKVVQAGGLPTLLASDLIIVGGLSCLAYFIYSRYRSGLAVALLLGPYICTGLAAAVGNWGHAGL